MTSARILVAAFLLLAAGATTHAFEKLVYDARVGWIEAGSIEMIANRTADRFYIAGSVETKGVIRRLIKWRGSFSAVGSIVDGEPEGEAYLLLEEKGDEREILLAANKKTVIYSNNRPTQIMDHPGGNDLMSSLFLGRHCFERRVVHDGEDPYELELNRISTTEIFEPKPYYRGATTRCDYQYAYKERVRRVSVWVADVEGVSRPVRIRVRVPFRPDGVLRLRTR